MINARSLKDRIEIKQPSRIGDGSGGYSEGFEPVATVWAAVNTLNGREFWQAQQMQAEVTHKIRIRRNPDVKRSHVVFFDSRVYEIMYILCQDKKRLYDDLYCVERL